MCRRRRHNEYIFIEHIYYDYDYYYSCVHTQLHTPCDDGPRATLIEYCVYVTDRVRPAILYVFIALLFIGVRYTVYVYFFALRAHTHTMIEMRTWNSTNVVVAVVVGYPARRLPPSPLSGNARCSLIGPAPIDGWWSLLLREPVEE